jgi:hypothetical protein
LKTVDALEGAGALDGSEQAKRARAIDRDAVRASGTREGSWFTVVSLAFPEPGAPCFS